MLQFMTKEFAEPWCSENQAKVAKKAPDKLSEARQMGGVIAVAGAKQ